MGGWSKDLRFVAGGELDGVAAGNTRRCCGFDARRPATFPADNTPWASQVAVAARELGTAQLRMLGVCAGWALVRPSGRGGCS